MRAFLVATIIVTTSATAALAATPYEGKWVSHHAHCKVPIGGTAPDGTTPDGTLIIKGKSLEGHEMSCRIKSARSKGDTWIIRSTCDSEGEVVEDVMTMVIHGDVATIKERGARLRCAR